MNKYLLILALLIGSINTNAQTFHGKKIEQNKQSLSAEKLEATMDGKVKLETRITGIVEDVCQAAGCWMKINTAEGKTMRVTFKDYAFFVPKNIAGKKVTFEGIALKKETSVADLKHYAQDAGKSEIEISKITKPEYAITFEAEGVIIEN
ncbi:MAG: DUF4920 domain-containing protein [Bacteroidota bacterium]